MSQPPNGLGPASAYAVVCDVDGVNNTPVMDALAAAGISIGRLLEEEWATERYNRFRDSSSYAMSAMSILRVELDYEDVEKLEHWIRVYRKEKVDIVNVIRAARGMDLV
jgi:hypothetical protein